MKRASLFCLCVAAASPIVGAQSTKPFHDLTFDKALEKARAENKIVFVDFFTTWCGPCKQLDKTTWKDEKVVAWLHEKTVALKVDAEAEEALASRYGVAAYPTLAFIKADGELLDSIVGYRDGETFVDEASATLEGRGSLVRAQEQVAAADGDPMVRSRYADELARKGRHEEALQEYLWCFDHGLESRPSYAGVRLSFLLSSISRLGKVHPPAMDALSSRRDAARERVLGSENPDFQAVMDLASLSRELGDAQSLLEVYDSLRKSGDSTRPARAMLVQLITETLIEEGRYHDIVEDGDIEGFLEMQEMILAHMAEGAGDLDEQTMTLLRRQRVEEVARYYEAALGAGEPELGERVAELVFRIDDSGFALSTLKKHARRAEQEGAIEALDAQWEKAKSQR